MVECAGLSEMTLNEEEIIEGIGRLLHEPTSEYLPTTHLTEHHIELTGYTPIRHHPRRWSPAMWLVAQDMHKAEVIEICEWLVPCSSDTREVRWGAQILHRLSRLEQ